MSKKINMRGWAENTSVTDNVRNYQSKMNRGSSGGKFYADAPPSNRKERRILAKYKRTSKNGHV